ncbi:replication factor C subunit 1 [Tanacetum coccineum]
MRKNYMLLEDEHVHLLSSLQFNLGRYAGFKLTFFSMLYDWQDEAVEKVVEFMDSYSISQEDLDSMMAMSKFQGHPSPLNGVQPVVKL